MYPASGRSFVCACNRTSFEMVEEGANNSCNPCKTFAFGKSFFDFYTLFKC